MSFEFDVSTSPPRRPRPMTQQLFRLEETHPFDPAVFGFPRGGVPSCNRGGGGTSGAGSNPLSMCAVAWGRRCRPVLLLLLARRR